VCPGHQWWAGACGRSPRAIEDTPYRRGRHRRRSSPLPSWTVTGSAWIRRKWPPTWIKRRTHRTSRLIAKLRGQDLIAKVTNFPLSRVTQNGEKAM